MFDVGWQELAVIAVIAIVVLGPKELPRVMRSVMGVMRKARMIAAEFHEAVNEAARQADLDDIKKQLAETAAVDLDPKQIVEHSIDPSGEMKKELQALGSVADEASRAPELPRSDSALQSTDEPKRPPDHG